MVAGEGHSCSVTRIADERVLVSPVPFVVLRQTTVPESDFYLLAEASDCAEGCCLYVRRTA